MHYDTLETERIQYEDLKRRILEADPDIDTPTLADTLEGATNLHAILAATTRSIIDDQATAAALKLRLADLQGRLSRLCLRVERKRDLILSTMEHCDIRNIREPDFTVSLKTAAAGLQVTDEAALPEWFWVPQPPKIDRARLLAALKAGEHVTGAALSNPLVQLQIRTK